MPPTIFDRGASSTGRMRSGPAFEGFSPSPQVPRGKPVRSPNDARPESRLMAQAYGRSDPRDDENFSRFARTRDISPPELLLPRKLASPPSPPGFWRKHDAT